MSSQLEHAVKWLKLHYEEVPEKERKGMCLANVRQSLLPQGLPLPWKAKPHNTALDCFAALKDLPGKWGWKRISHPLPEYCLVFFGGCGKLADGRIAGHIAILHDGILYADIPLKYTKTWQKRLKGAFVPKV